MIESRGARAVSVVIPTYGRPERLAQCLQSMCALRGASFEVVVVDDGSPDPAEHVTRGFADRLRLTTLRQANAGPATARNRGAAAAKGAIIAFTDDDCLVDPEWLETLTARVHDDPSALVGGATINMLTDNIFSEASQDLVTFLYEHAQKKGRGFDYFTSNNMACRRDRFLEVGGFDETFPLAAAEDREFGLRWKASGGALVYEPAARIRHAHLLDLRRFWRQQANYGRGARHLRLRVEARNGDKIRFEGLKFYVDMAAYPFRARRPRAAERAALLGLSQIATAAGFLDESFLKFRKADGAT